MGGSAAPLEEQAPDKIHMPARRFLLSLPPVSGQGHLGEPEERGHD
jgi:hypothetical protein